MSAEQPDFEFETILPHTRRVEVLRVPYPLNFKRADHGYVDMRWRRTLRRRARRKNRRAERID